ncbi:SulP family inorganic anion transporter [Microbulbifer sp. GL-2]|uniref:SulP family inorganic anion transporter n=1 Tax=Microbulbifer sp. GL-2 TaxID=2591606 RepID=UPI001162C285|nr:sulfate permease [Microbulbifer sp. GL-2]BBM04084.1 sodium-independent anion transporter [Microbulbifer sp. GL-2]
MRAQHLIPPWLKRYQPKWLVGDAVAALLASMMLIPQALAYAALAGLPPYLGLYAGLLPLVGYALFGSSSVLSVGPVAVLALMTASALTPIAIPGSAEYISGAILLALLSGIILLLMGFLGLGSLSNLLSLPVVDGFVSGAAILIMVGQIAPLLGIEGEGHTALEILVSTLSNSPMTDPEAALLGLVALASLIAARLGLPFLLRKMGASPQRTKLLSRLAPMLIVLISILLTTIFHWEKELPVVGVIPSGLPALKVPSFNLAMVYQLLLPALIIALLGFVESLSVAHSIALRRGEKLDANAELRGLGASNLLSAFSGGFAVTGSFARTAVNDEAGAKSPLSGIIAAILIALVLLYATKVFTELPICVLAATIIVAAANLIDLRAMAHHWRYDRTDGLAMGGTFLGVILFGVEAGIGLGVGLSFATLIWRTSRPHIAVVGRVPGTEQFRNVLRHTVKTLPDILFLRIDENLFFSNISAVEERLLAEVKRHPNLHDMVLILSSVNRIDSTAIERLQQINSDLLERNICLHLAEVKGPVLDRLGRSKLLQELSGRVFLSSYIAELALRHHKIHDDNQADEPNSPADPA